MLDTVEALRVQKALLEKQEKTLIDQINKKVELQSERMRQLGIEKKAEKALLPNSLAIPATWR